MAMGEKLKKTKYWGFILIGSVAVVLLLLLAASLSVPKPGFTDATGLTIIFQDDFEHSNYTSFPSTEYDRGILDEMYVGDDKFGDNYSWDWWGVTDYRYHAGKGNHSLWCAQNGDNSAYGNVPNKMIHKIDYKMIAYFENLFEFGNYDSITLEFWYWSQATYNPTDVVADMVCVLTSNGTGVGGAGFKIIWRQPTNSTNGTWAHVILDIPTSAKLVGFYYFNEYWYEYTYPPQPLLEGAYIDDIILSGYKNPIPEHPVKINIMNTNNPSEDYGGNPKTNGGLSLNISLNGTLFRQVFIMPGETVYFFISMNNLPITMTLKTSAGISTYKLDDSNVHENEMYSFTINSTPI